MGRSIECTVTVIPVTAKTQKAAAGVRRRRPVQKAKSSEGLFVGVAVGGVAGLVAVGAVLMRGGGVFLGLVVAAMFMVMGGLPVVVRGAFVMRRGGMVMFARGMFGRHIRVPRVLGNEPRQQETNGAR